ncbi:hypothetical protein G7075_04395 [Phycicoccus sp. HDW14]|uniref:hypothetical protein n=1 Tax=Phycicoccus sp. HDW14 TaxID=2714941 RepID=UPI0014099AEC|nr:hypothetical protein [Phycicoccus sp. HDW14]QIM20558.1 hypothetical protein G7075_04395 [Phycicoccus sp. HDW14]
MSVAFTEAAVLNRSKTVTRRKGWWEDRRGRRILTRGTRLTLCRKVMGRKPGEPLVRLCDVEVISVRREPLAAVMGPYTITPAGKVIWTELVAEGFPDLEPMEFMRRYFIDPQGIELADDVTRIEWRYLEEARR